MELQELACERMAAGLVIVNHPPDAPHVEKCFTPGPLSTPSSKHQPLCMHILRALQCRLNFAPSDMIEESSFHRLQTSDSYSQPWELIRRMPLSDMRCFMFSPKPCHARTCIPERFQNRSANLAVIHRHLHRFIVFVSTTSQAKASTVWHQHQ